MSPLRFAIDKPVTVLVGVILVALFGTLAALTLPIQLTPDVDNPIVNVTTRWEGASPLDVEREIIDEQEEQLKSIEGLREMTSTAVEGIATVELEFAVDADINRALLDVSDKLRQVPEYPENVDEPVVSAGETEGANAIAWFVLQPTAGSTVDVAGIPRMRTLIEEVVKPRLERADGVAAIGVIGGVEREVHVHVDPVRLAARGLTLLDVRAAIREHNVDVSAGSIEQGKRAYTIRTIGKFERLDQIESLVLARRDGKPVYLRDVGSAAFGFKEAADVVRALGTPSIAVNATRQNGSNVIEVMESLVVAVADANERILRPKGVELLQVYDQTEYIDNAIDLVFGNLWVGGALTVFMLLLFLRNARTTLIISVAIPVSTIGAFLALVMLGRNLNVISLAGLAFAIGMVVDNSIVVLENIVRHRQEGKSAYQAALIGTQEVWGAVLASTLTTLAVFVPIVYVQEEAGQLFRDIAIAISAAVGLSLIVSVLFLPMAASRLLGVGNAEATSPWLDRLFAPFIAFGGRFNRGVDRILRWTDSGWFARSITVGGLTAASFVLSWMFLPPMSYLPQGNQNLVIGFVIPPPGYNPAEFERIAHQVEAVVSPYFVPPTGPRRELPDELRRPDWYQGEEPLPGVVNFFYVARGQSIFMGARSDDEENVKPLEQLLMHAAAGVPGTMVFAAQRSLFERGVSAGNSIEVQVSGTQMAGIQQTALALMGVINQKLGPPRPEPSNFALGAPEVQVGIDEARAAQLDLSVADLGFMVQSMVDGAIVSDFRDQGVNIDVKIVPVVDRKHLGELKDVPLFTRSGDMVPLGSVAALHPTTAPTDIRHIELERAVTLFVTAPEGMELSRAMEVLETDVLAPLRQAGGIPEDVSVNLSGTADKLVSTRDALKWNFVLALVITYLLLAALFEHFLYPVVIMFSVPLAAVGGILGLRLVHEFTGHQMDVLTMLGFVILIGTVVNNAILIVDRALQSLREGVDLAEAVRTSVSLRVRPMFMTTATSVLGMLPLVLFPGAGSELYRGLGSVVVGGLTVSTVFTLFVVPTSFAILFRATRRLRELFGMQAAYATARVPSGAREADEPLGAPRASQVAREADVGPEGGASGERTEHPRASPPVRGRL